MKKIFSLLFLLATLLGYSQQKNFTIEWNDSKIYQTADSQIEIPSFDRSHMSFDYANGLKFFAEWPSSELVNEKTAALTNVSYAPISQADLKQLPLHTISSTPQLKLRNSQARDKRFTYLEISPIISDNGVYKKITKFTVSYSASSSRNSTARLNQTIVNSVLATGSWYRFYVDKSGVFKITKDFMNQLGVNTNVNPRTIKVFGNGGQMLPFENNSDYPFDLTENAIKFVGEEDGVFNDQDYILFYAEGPKGRLNPGINTNINPYTDKSYYYINISSGNGKRIQTMTQPSGSPTLNIDSFHDYQFHEIDEFNLVKVGRRWFGNRFSIENEQEFNFEFSNLVSSEPARVRVYTVAMSNLPTSMQVRINGTQITTLSYSPINENTLAREANYQGNQTLTNAEVAVQLIFNNGGNPSSEAYLDFISIEALRLLRFEGSQFIFKNNNVATSGGIVEYSLTNATSVKEIWDITDIYNVTTALNSDQSETFRFKDQAGALKTYVTVPTVGHYVPLRDGNVSVANQNIKGTIFNNQFGEFEDVDYIIVAPDFLISQAERLAQINRDQYNLNVKVLSNREIYNEFSSGNQDVGAIRNLIKYVYDNASSPANRIKYLCLFGDASYDYKDRISNNTNIVPSWHAYESFDLTSSFVSDDFFGMMDMDEGTMAISDRLDIAVGRILAENPQRAKEMVDKIELYYDESSYGSWRNNFVVVSDDVDEAWERQLQETTDAIADNVTAEKPFINAIKIHSDAFQQEASSSGERYPKGRKALKDAMEVGALVVNYFGHGGEDNLSSERIFDKNDAQEIRNICRFNCFMTITCEFTRFDNPSRPTGGEYMYWNTQGGAIGLLTTTRKIFVPTGRAINEELEQYLFAFDSYDYPSIAEALRLTKMHPAVVGYPQKTLVFFVGDPAMKLSIPKPSVRLTHINDEPLGATNDTLKALSKIKLAGEVVDASGNLLSNYTGTLTATIFDKNIERQTLGNDGTTQGGEVIKMDFTTLGEKLFIGQASITNGLFDFEFVVPRDIAVPVGNGKVSFYAKTTTPLEDQSGASFDILVGGINENAEEDNVGPVINLFMNDENFVSGGITNESPTLLAKLQDGNGINTASGIGHDISAIIDGDETNPFILNDYYSANVDDYQNGVVSYPFRDLEPGLHTLTLKAWDVYNNSSTAEIQFVVHDKDEELVINNVLNYPNPFINYTEFWFNHNSSEPLDVSIQIFTVSGKLVRTLNGQTTGGLKSSSTLSKDIVWDGRDDFGDKIGKGVYVYKLKVRSNQLHKQVEKVEKLVIL